MKSAALVYLCLALTAESAHAGSAKPTKLGAWAKLQTLSWRISTPRGVDAVGEGENDAIRTQTMTLSNDGTRLMYKYQDVTLDTSGNYSPVEHRHQLIVPLEQVTVADPELDPGVSPVTVLYGVKLGCLNRDPCISGDHESPQKTVWLTFSSLQEANAASGKLRERLDSIAMIHSKPHESSNSLSGSLQR